MNGYVWAAGFVANGDSHIEITGASTRHDIYVKLDEFGTKPEITHQTEESVHLGTRLRVWWPQAACCLEALNVLRMVYQFSYCNPHVGFIYNGQEIAIPSTKIARWHKNKAPSSHWYNKADLQRQIAASQNITLSQLISSFDGLKRTDKRQLITSQFSDMKDAYDRASDMLKLMQANTKAHPPKALGVLGRTTFFQALDHLGVDADLRQYKKIECIDCDTTLPWVIEAAAGVRLDDGDLDIHLMINNSPALKMAIEWLPFELADNFIQERTPVSLLLHLACPKINYQEAGKGAIELSYEQTAAIEDVVKAVTSKWRKIVANYRRGQVASQREIEAAAKRERKKQLSTKDACERVLEKAYIDVSDNNTLPANARQLMYAVRARVINMGVDWYKDAATFTQKILPDFIDAKPDLCAEWNVVYDARGHLLEPYTEKELGLGTTQIREYHDGWETILGDLAPKIDVNTHFKTTDPSLLYSAVVFIEKEGFDALIAASHLREKFGIATMSTKGIPTTAARELVDHFTSKDIPIFVLRDFDIAGFNIVKTLTQDNRRYKFKSTPLVFDLGLRLADAQRLNLMEEEFTVSNQAKDPGENLRDFGATEEEIDFIVEGRASEKTWNCRRVELNAMTSRQFIDFIVENLSKRGIEPFIPDNETLVHVYRQQMARQRMEAFVEDASEDFDPGEIEPPDDLRAQVANLTDGQGWHQAIRGLVENDSSENLHLGDY